MFSVDIVMTVWHQNMWSGWIISLIIFVWLKVLLKVWLIWTSYVDQLGLGCFVLVYFWDRVSLYSSGWSRTVQCIWRSEVKMKESVLPLVGLGDQAFIINLGIELTLSVLASSTFAHQAILLAFNPVLTITMSCTSCLMSFMTLVVLVLFVVNWSSMVHCILPLKIYSAVFFSFLMLV